ncbi:MAG: [ribosomal protein S18]-alanine N-acetyltransferase [Thermoplasmata archaeon]|jgi:ribosomal-protein-alanine N-acetyltransferase|nr:[ribosomal protein S18]-alanine N-acetyltransferase [Thermoplasmata archaeon]
MLVVEPIRMADAGQVANLALRSLRERYDPAWLEHQMGKGGPFLIARDIPTNAVVGFAVADQKECEGHLLALAVDRERRGEGIGSALLSNVRQELARAGAFKLRLEVRADDGAALAFYRRHGFYPDGLETHVYSDGGDAIRMQRSL